MKKEFFGGIIGTMMSSAGAFANLTQWLTIISTIITILGGIITLIVIPIVSWYKKAKADGKITKEEIKEGANIIKDGIEQLQDKKDKEEK